MARRRMIHTLGDLRQAAREIAQWAVWESESLDGFHRYAQQHGGQPGGNVLKFVLEDALRLRKEFETPRPSTEVARSSQERLSVSRDVHVNGSMVEVAGYRRPLNPTEARQLAEGIMVAAGMAAEFERFEKARS